MPRFNPVNKIASERCVSYNITPSEAKHYAVRAIEEGMSFHLEPWPGDVWPGNVWLFAFRPERHDWFKAEIHDYEQDQAADVGNPCYKCGQPCPPDAASNICDKCCELDDE